MGRRILHTGGLGSASVLKVVTNYLCSVHLAALGEAMMTAKLAGMDLNTTYEAIRISSGNSFVHETESQIILNGSRDISFTMGLVVKDMSLFQALGDRHAVPLELSPLVLGIFEDGQQRYGSREWSPNIVRRLEEACGERLLAPGFPAEIVDDETEAPGHEVVVERGGLSRSGKHGGRKTEPDRSACGIEPDRDRTVVDEMHLHRGAETPIPNRHPVIRQCTAE